MSVAEFASLIGPAMGAAVELQFNATAERIEGRGEPTETSVISVVGFAGRSVSGSFGLCASAEWLLATHPLGAEYGGDDSDLLDWAGELANQLLGAVKRRMIEHDVEFWPSTPVTLRGLSIARHDTGEYDTWSYRIASDTLPEKALAWIEFHRPADLAFGVASQTKAKAPDPGAVLLF